MQKHNKQQYEIIKCIYRKIKKIKIFINKNKHIKHIFVTKPQTNKKHNLKQKCRKRIYNLSQKQKTQKYF